MANTLKFGKGEWATKDGSILAYNDENNNFKPLPFNFTRDSGATRVNKEGLIEVVSNNEPRIDFLNDSKGALLLEPSKSNLVTYSEDFSDASWIKASSTVTANSTISPKGDLTADTFELTGSAGRLQRNVTLSDNTDYTLSCFIKPISVTNNLLSVVAIRKDGSVSVGIFNISNGAISSETNCTAKIESYTNGWYRLSITFDSLSGATSPSIRPISNSTGNGGFTTDDSVYIWGAQVEQGSYATSYIPTQGSAVTRVADVCNGAGNSQVINSTEGVLYFEGSALADDGTFRCISISDASNTSNRMFIQYDTTSNFDFILFSGGIGQCSLTTAITQTDNVKIAVKYKTNDFALWVNGIEVATDSDGITFSADTLDKLSFDATASSFPFYGNVKQIQYFDTALTDLQLQQLTTL